MNGAGGRSFLSSVPYRHPYLFQFGVLSEPTPKLLFVFVLLFARPWLTCVPFAGISQQTAVLGLK